MNILIIEDEVQTAWDLKQALLKLSPVARVVGVIDSVEAGREWLAANSAPDLVFSDIQLGDGLAFEIFDAQAPGIPIIFCTAYDEYLLQAFRTNGIDYILKPLDEADVRRSLDKFATLRQAFTSTAANSFQALSTQIRPDTYRTTFLVSYRDKLYPLRTEQIQVFLLENGSTALCTAEGKRFTVSYTLEQLEKVLDPNEFYRANRQVIISRRGISEIEHYFERKLLVYMQAFRQSS